MPSTRLLHSQRQSLLFLERSRVRVEGDRVVYDIADETLIRAFNIPHANLSCLLLGQGTSITQAAMRQLAEQGVLLGITGSGGTPLLMASFDVYRPTERLRQWLPIYAEPAASLEAARTFQRQRIKALEELGEKNVPRFRIDWVEDAAEDFERAIARATTIDQLSGAEGQFCKRLYASVCKGFGIQGFTRQPGAGADRKRDTTSPDTAGRMNALIDHGNYLAYGMAAVALWAHGIPAGLSVMHGRTRAGGLVFDLADSFKDAFIVLAAAEAAAKGDVPESQFRGRVIASFDDRKLLTRVFATLDLAIERAGAAT
jgi:CRISPR-associated protein Cas1